MSKLTPTDFEALADFGDTEFLCNAYEALHAESTEQAALVKELAEALGNLHALVWGECPSLLNEDSGGSGHLDVSIREVLAKVKAKEQP